MLRAALAWVWIARMVAQTKWAFVQHTCHHLVAFNEAGSCSIKLALQLTVGVCLATGDSRLDGI